jgi:DNA-binding transcriptional ArsR family regulator
MESGAKEREVPVPANRALAQALEHPLRARIAAELEKRDLSREELAAILEEPLPLVAYHREVLAAVGLI